ncbi:MAG: ATP-dependent DNA helicase RecG [Candidatus Pacebacteria bacterium]|nr:ATP-dependent DNA helicase RecG [Candidatus Paceibacterota bacterium]
MNLSNPITHLKGVGDTSARSLDRLGIRTLSDLIYHIPFRYDDFRVQKTIAELESQEVVTVCATVHSITKIQTRRNMTMIKAVLTDESGKIDAVWFNQQYLLMTLRKGTEKYFSGKVTEYQGKKTLNNPTIEDVSHENQLHSGRLVPIYSETEGISSRTLRTLVSRALESLDSIEDSLTENLRATYHLPPLEKSLQFLHFPENEGDIHIYRRRLAFEEVYTLLLAAQQKKQALQIMKVPHPLQFSAVQRKAFESVLPFTLSPSQLSALLDLSLDLLKPYPSNRLIQGEVGSGKTIVAAFALYCAAVNSVNSVLVAPTQILATQHFQSLHPIFEKLDIPVYCVTADQPLQNTEVPAIYIGTHALFSQSKTLNPAVVVIDEEHRFGVEQREAFWQKKKRPHLITMTATPIPRTVAQTILADKDVSFLEEIPERKKHITTKIVSETKRQDAYHWIEDQIEKERAGVFVVCPFIQQSENVELELIKSAEQEYQRMVHQFPHRTVALLHGKTPKDERGRVLQSMAKKEIDILVATPIIEVGIDIPHASIMIIEGAERFGLAQLHQLRGRIGRVGQKAYCLLVPTQGIDETKRLKIMQTNATGNELAEYDLKLRGTGDLLGTRQHGWDALRFASWFDHELIKECKEAVSQQPFGERKSS